MTDKHIVLKLNRDIAVRLCDICQDASFDVNIICGRSCVDGSSIVGLMNLCNKFVQIAPVTKNDSEFYSFFSKVRELGGFLEEVL